MKIVIGGGTGFIGEYFSRRFREEGNEVTVISRRHGHILWTETDKISRVLDEADMVINLAGKSVNCRYTDKNKAEIISSRTETTKTLGRCLQRCKTPPSLWINASTATIYRDSEDRPMDEATGEIGNGFSVDVAKQWEKSFFDFNIAGVRQVALRITIVLGKAGGVLRPYRNMVLTGFGGRQGKGTQMFSWIHVEDLYQAILFLYRHPRLEGVFNCGSPAPVTNNQFMLSLRKAMHVPVGIPLPAALLKLGAFMIGTEPELLLKSRWVIPGRLSGAGFRFKYAGLDDALKQLFQKG